MKSEREIRGPGADLAVEIRALIARWEAEARDRDTPAGREMAVCADRLREMLWKSEAAPAVDWGKARVTGLDVWHRASFNDDIIGADWASFVSLHEAVFGGDRAAAIAALPEAIAAATKVGRADLLAALDGLAKALGV